jgi:hypothetical protein
VWQRFILSGGLAYDNDSYFYLLSDCCACSSYYECQLHDKLKYSCMLYSIQLPDIFTLPEREIEAALETEVPVLLLIDDGNRMTQRTSKCVNHDTSSFETSIPARAVLVTAGDHRMARND